MPFFPAFSGTSAAPRGVALDVLNGVVAWRPPPPAPRAARTTSGISCGFIVPPHPCCCWRRPSASGAHTPRTRELGLRTPSPRPPRRRRSRSRASRSQAVARPARPTRRPASCWSGRRATRPCLLGKTWGYDQTSVWVSDGCSAEFVTGAGAETGPTESRSRPSTSRTSGSCSSTARRGRSTSASSATRAISISGTSTRPTSTRSATPQTVQRRQDVQLQKFFAPFSGWFLTPKLRYYLYVWSSNASQGDPAQVVGAGNLS